MANENKTVITIETKYDGKGETKAKKALEQLVITAKTTNDEIKKGTMQATEKVVLWSNALNLAKTAWSGMKGLVSWFGDCIDAANKNARSVNMLAAAYKDVGYTTAGAMEKAKQFASEMQSMTGIADEAFLDAQRLLANYGVVGSKAQEAIRAAYSLSIAKNMDFASAVDLVTKAAAGQQTAPPKCPVICSVFATINP